MADGTCSVPDCERPIKVKVHRLCGMHHLRWLKTGEVGSAEPRNRPAPPECTVPDCHGKPHGRGLCAMHHMRKKLYGDPGTAEKRRKPSPSICTFDGCDRKPKALGLCDLHYKRQWKHGDPALGASRVGADDVSYFAVHVRLTRWCGRAADLPCAMCGGMAYDWAYDHDDPDEIRDADGRVYSLDPARYLPVCRPCHRKLDAA